MLKVTANGVACFEWSGTRADAVDLQKRYLDCVNANGLDAQSYAKRAVGYLMAFGPPIGGQPRLTPTGFGEPWAAEDVELNRLAALWLGLREHIPNSGSKVEDVFVGKVLAIMFDGDRELILAETHREQGGQPFTGREFQMMVGVLEARLLLDPAEAIAMPDNIWGLLVALGASQSGVEVTTAAQPKPTGAPPLTPNGKPLFPPEHKVLTLHLSKRSTVAKVVARSITRHKNREHEVRSHFRTYMNPDGSVRARVLIRSHTRGDARLGRVQKEYRVER